MKKITLEIPDDKWNFFKELVNELGLVVSEEIEIPDEHKAIVRKRLAKSHQDPDRLLDWDQVQDRLDLE
jgi:hypothetical protein